MSDIEELREYFRRLNNAVSCLVMVRHHTNDLIEMMSPEFRPNVEAISELMQEALQNIAWVCTRISMECYNDTDGD